MRLGVSDECGKVEVCCAVLCFAGRACLCKDKMGEQRPSEIFQTACLCNDDLLIRMAIRDFNHRL